MKMSIPHFSLPSPTNMRLILSLIAFALVFFSPVAFAAGALNCADTGTKVTGFLNNINGLLNIASIAIVTIAVIFAGYQIAFAHKRIADVAPILIGGLLIGAAGQIAKMIIGTPTTTC